MFKKHEHGFTLVEMLVVAPIVILAIGAFLTVIISMTGEVIASRTSNALSYNVQDGLNRIEQDVKQSTGFLAATNIAALYGSTNSPLNTTDAQGYNNDTTDFTNVTTGTTGPMLILNMIATTDNPLTSGSSYVYLRDKPNACTSPQGNAPLTYNVVYFVRGTGADSTLYRRVIMPRNYATVSTNVCLVPWQQPSCSTEVTVTPATHCKTNDVTIVRGVSPKDFTLQYYAGENTNSVNSVASNTSTSVTDRNVALQSATTVGVSITAKQMGGGREVSRTATLRASRLDTNATSFIIPTTDGAPVAPTISKSSAPGAKGKFTWPSVSGATGYTADYTLNSGTTWTNIFTNQPTRTATVSSNANKDTINIRVRSVGAAGSSSYATASVVTPSWDAMDYQSIWNDFGAGYVEGSYTKTASGAVFLRGLVKKGAGVAATQGEVITTLPDGYRPAYTMYFAVAASGGDSSGTIRVDPNGDVIVSQGASGDWTSLSRVSFLPSGAPYTWTNLTPVNSYSNRNAATDPPYSYTIDSTGRAYIRGTLNAGTSGANISSLPASMQVSPKLIYAVRSGGSGYNDVDISTVVTHRGTAAGSTINLNMMYVPDSAGATWTKPTLSAGWSTFSSANAAEGYTKSTDGVVTLRGLIKGGTITNGTVLFTLPAGYRPSATIAFNSICNTTPCRVDVSANGNVLARGFDANWSSLSGVSFVADQ